MRRVQAGETVAAAARDLLVGWQTVMRAVIAYGQPLVDDPDRLAGVAGLSVDEHVWTHASPSRRTGYATGIVDLTPGQPARLLDVVAGRSGQVYTDWIAEREQQWREQIRTPRSIHTAATPPRWPPHCQKRHGYPTRSASSR